MKKNRSMRLAVVLLALTLITTCFVSGTFAKYISDADIAGTFTVAEWNVTVNGNAITNSTHTFNLFDTIKDTAGANEADVATGLIAPGTSGSFSLTVANASEVNAKYRVEFVETNADNVPLQYSTNGTDWVDDIADLDVVATDLPMTGATASQTVTIQWRWVYENGVDDADTTLGEKAQNTAPTVTITATLTAWQVD